MKNHFGWTGIVAFLVLTALAGCGGGGGGGEGSGSAPGGPPANVAGNWTVTETGTTNTCGELVDPPYPINIAQNGNSITVTTPVGTFSGSINGNVVNWTGSYPEDGGTTTITSLTATVSGNTFSGRSNWTWTGPGGACSGSTTFTGTLTSPAPTTVTIGGNISGLSGTVVLQNNGGDNLSRSVNGTFTFATAINSGSIYNVTVLTKPTGQICTVSNGSGTATANVTNISVTCSATTFTLTTTTTGSGSVTRNPNQASYAAGSQVQLTAVPQPGNSFSSWSGGLTGTQNPATVIVNSNLTITANFVVAANTLTVVKAGLGSGTVTGTGISCGTDCSQSPVSGQIVLTATPATGSTFGSWTGCDSVNTNQCTVNMTSGRTVTATFNLGLTLGQLNVSVPTTDADGNYSVTISIGSGGLGSTTVILQEAPNTAFVSPTVITLTNVGTLPLAVPISGRTPGTYCYRAAYSTGSFGNSACVAVSPPATTAALRIVNNSSYDLIDVRLNNVQRASYPYAILSRSSFDFVFTSGGTVTYALGNGFYNSDGSRDIWFTFSGQVSLTLGQTLMLTVNNPTIGQLLTNFTVAQNWDGMYFANLNSFFARYRFTSATNGWQFFDSTAPCFSGSTCTFTQVGAGTVRLVSWPVYSPTVTFDFGPGTNAAIITFPFGSFLYRNGPASWPTIEYVRQ